ncbi:thymidylate kinase [Morchella conica CCBAS932]|uniref:Thymidylate kinase n=1 Tax=Morchella conica CCBAS932 TaxID=1392247 RepID=A0A3N4L5S3_9PEZI|nr:thymidylate kinase [Morchella conica CCBAS932]
MASTETATAPPRGILIAIEGLDRAGKSTQCALLVERLQQSGHKVRLQKFPDRTTTIGTLINSYLTSATDIDDHTIHLLFSANRWELAHSIRTDIAAGVTVVLDRYMYSGVVFSAAKGLDYEYCRGPEVGLPRPDVIVFMDLDEGEAAKRGGFGEERYEVPEVQRRVREMFRMMRGDERDAGDWGVVDAGAEVGVVAERVWGVVERGVEFARGNELRSIQ